MRFFGIKMLNLADKLTSAEVIASFLQRRVSDFSNWKKKIMLAQIGTNTPWQCRGKSKKYVRKKRFLIAK